MRSIAICSLLVSLLQPAFPLECGEPFPVKTDSIVTRLLTSIRDPSIPVRRRSAQELKSLSDSLEVDSRLYDSLVSYSLENLYTYYHLKFSEGIDWLDKFQAQELPAVCRRYKAERNVELRRALLLSLEGKKLSLAEAILNEAFNDPDSTIGVESVRIYGKNKFDSAFLKMKGFIDSGSLPNKVGAIRGLSYFADTTSVSLLLKMVLLKENQRLSYDFTLIPANMRTMSAEYIIDTTTPKKGRSLHDEAFFSIEEITGKPAEMKVGKVVEWLNRESRKKTKSRSKNRKTDNPARQK